MIELPELPEPSLFEGVALSGVKYARTDDGHTDEAMRAYGIACANAALEAAAKVCEATIKRRHNETWRKQDNEYSALTDAEKAILALMKP